MNKLLAQSFTIGDFKVEGPKQFAFANKSIGFIIGQALTYVFAFAGVGLLLMIIGSGFTLMLSAGDPKKMEKGKQSLTNSIIGFILIFSAFWIVQILGIVFGWENGIGAIFGQ